MKRTIRVLGSLSVAFVVSNATVAYAQPGAPAGAQPPPAQPAPAAAAAKPSPEAMEKARGHYERGLQLYQEEDYGAALTEFERAYELAPTAKLLYNMARIQRHQNNYVAALTNYQRYLAEGGDAVPEDRRKEVEKEIAVLKPRLASVEVTVNQPDAEVFIDDAPVCANMGNSGCKGTSPLSGPVFVNPGRRKVSASKAGFAVAAQSITVAGSDSVKVNLDLQALGRESKYDPAPRNRALVAWGVTAVFTAGAVATGVVALNASSKLDRDLGRLSPDPGTLKDSKDQMKTFAIVSDVFIGAAAISGLVATYFTVKAVQGKKTTETTETPPPPPTAKVKFDVGPTGAMLHGTF